MVVLGGGGGSYERGTPALLSSRCATFRAVTALALGGKSLKRCDLIHCHSEAGKAHGRHGCRSWQLHGAVVFFMTLKPRVE